MNTAVASRPLSTQDATKMPRAAKDHSTIKAIIAAINSRLSMLADALAQAKQPSELVKLFKVKLLETAPPNAQFLLYKLDPWLTKRPAWVKVFCKCRIQDKNDHKVDVQFTFGGAIDMADGQGAKRLEEVRVNLRAVWRESEPLADAEAGMDNGQGDTEKAENPATATGENAGAGEEESSLSDRIAPGKWELTTGTIGLADPPVKEVTAAPSPSPDANDSENIIPLERSRQLRSRLTPSPLRQTLALPDTSAAPVPHKTSRKNDIVRAYPSGSADEMNSKNLLERLVRMANKSRLPGLNSRFGIPTGLIARHLARTPPDVARSLVPSRPPFLSRTSAGPGSASRTGLDRSPDSGADGEDEGERIQKWATVYSSFQEIDLDPAKQDLVVCCFKYSGEARYSQEEGAELEDLETVEVFLKFRDTSKGGLQDEKVESDGMDKVKNKGIDNAAGEETQTHKDKVEVKHQVNKEDEHAEAGKDTGEKNTQVQVWNRVDTKQAEEQEGRWEFMDGTVCIRQDIEKWKVRGTWKAATGAKGALPIASASLSTTPSVEAQAREG